MCTDVTRKILLTLDHRQYEAANQQGEKLVATYDNLMVLHSCCKKIQCRGNVLHWITYHGMHTRSYLVLALEARAGIGTYSPGYTHIPHPNVEIPLAASESSAEIPCIKGSTENGSRRGWKLFDRSPNVANNR